MKMQKIYQNKYIYIIPHESEIPWVKIFTVKKYKELSDCDAKTKECVYKSIEIVEKTMREFYEPEKINIAMFGNYLPHLHVHVMARFKEDSYFPECIWGEKQRVSKLTLPSFDEFTKKLKTLLMQLD